MDILVTFSDSKKTKQTYSVASFEFHTYGFLELLFVDGTVEQINLRNVFAIKYLPLTTKK